MDAVTKAALQALVNTMASTWSLSGAMHTLDVALIAQGGTRNNGLRTMLLPLTVVLDPPNEFLAGATKEESFTNTLEGVYLKLNELDNDQPDNIWNQFNRDCMEVEGDQRIKLDRLCAVTDLGTAGDAALALLQEFSEGLRALTNLMLEGINLKKTVSVWRTDSQNRDTRLLTNPPKTLVEATSLKTEAQLANNLLLEAVHDFTTKVLCLTEQATHMSRWKVTQLPDFSLEKASTLEPTIPKSLMKGDPNGAHTKKVILERSSTIEAALATLTSNLTAAKTKRELDYQRKAFKEDMASLQERVKTDLGLEDPSRFDN